MELTFTRILNTSISAGWLVLAIVAVRPLLGKAPKGIRCLLWALVAVRLLCPFSIESPFSLLPDSQRVPELYRTIEGETAVYDTVLKVAADSLYPALTGQPGASADPAQIFDALWTAVWLLGVGAMVGYMVVSVLLVRRKVCASIALEGNIRVCDEIDSPFLLGLFSPKIYLPSSLPPEDREPVLAHERAHLRRKDHWWKPLGFVLLSVYWFHPLMWLAYLLLCRDIEMACDERVIRQLDAPGRRAYSAALLHCSAKPHSLRACPLAFGEVGVKARVKSVLNYRRPAFWVVVISLALCAAVAVCFLTDPETEPEPTQPTPVSEPAPSTTAEDPMENGKALFLGWDTGNVCLTLPADWEYETLDSGYAFRPKGQSRGWVKLQFWPEGIGLCGTGLETETMSLPCGQVTACYYDGNPQWDYLIYDDLPGSFAVTREETQDWWADYETQAMEFLGCIRLAEGLKTRQEIQEIARGALESYARQAVMDADEQARSVLGEPTYVSHFDSSSGLWSVSLYFVTDSSPRAMVWLDAQGQVLCSGAGMVPMP